MGINHIAMYLALVGVPLVWALVLWTLARLEAMTLRGEPAEAQPDLNAFPGTAATAAVDDIPADGALPVKDALREAIFGPKADPEPQAAPILGQLPS